MLFHLCNYDFDYHIVSYSTSDESEQKLLNSKLEYVKIKNDRMYFYPQNISYQILTTDLHKIHLLNDYDVFEISPEGITFRYYNNKSEDNAFVVTGKCNSNCIMCPTSENVRKIANSYNSDTLIDFAVHIPSDARHFTITGGEPFMIGKSIFEFFAYLQSKFHNTDILLLTNGRIFSSEEYSNLMKKTAPNNLIIGIPLHGFNAETHDMITQVPGSFEQTVKGIKNLLKLGLQIELRLVVSRISSSYMDQLSELIVQELSGVNCVKIMAMEMLGNAAKNFDKVWIKYSDAFKSTVDLTKKLVSHGIDTAYYNFPLCTVDPKYFFICKKSISDYKIRYLSECEQCWLKSACGGIFAGTFRLEKNDISPIKRMC